MFSGKVEAGIEVGWMNYVFKFQVPTMHPPGALWEVRCYFRQVGFFVSAAGRENLFSSSAVLQKDESEQHLICIFSSFGMITELEVFFVILTVVSLKLRARFLGNLLLGFASM